MTFAVFNGEFDVTIDEKNRFLVPSAVRRMLEPEREREDEPVLLMMTVGFNRKPWIYTTKFYKVLASQEPPEWIPDKNVLAFRQLYFGGSSELELDKQSRVLLPAKTLQRTQTGRQVTLVGVGEHLELWNTNEWEAHFNQLLDTSGEVAERAKEVSRKIDKSPV